MSDPNSNLDTLERGAQIDALCDRFEALWQSGGKPSGAEFLRSVGVDPGSAHPDLIRELGRVEAYYRAAKGRSDGVSTTTHAPGAPTATPSPRGDNGVADATAPTPPALRSVGRYDLGELVGRGGMGDVYRARDRALGRDVAVKLLADRYAPDSPAGRRFLVEARITGQLQHPGIPPVHQVGALPDGRPFLAMKLIQGRTLAELLAERLDLAADTGRFLGVFEQVCQAVGYAHAHHVIHRDLKPANVMVGAFGEVQVMDWGLAKVLGGTPVRGEAADPGAAAGTEIRSARETADETQAGSLLGSPAYMPPEQATGAVDQVDARSDVFGLGGILCTILTGRPPYVGDTAESTRQLAARAHLDDALARLDVCRAEPELVALCRRCLTAERADRPADAGAVAAAVADLRAAADERARQAELDRVRSEGERAKAEAEAREQRGRRGAQLAVGAAVGLLLAGSGALAWWSERLKTAREVEKREEILTNTGRALVSPIVARLHVTDPEMAPAMEQFQALTEQGWPDKLRRYSYRVVRVKAPEPGWQPETVDDLAVLYNMVLNQDQAEQVRPLPREKSFLYYGGVRATQSCIECHTSPDRLAGRLGLPPTDPKVAGLDYPGLEPGQLMAVVRIQLSNE